MFIVKHIETDIKTTVALEPLFWQALEALTDSPGTWITEQLLSRPSGTGMASWIRQRILRAHLPNDFGKKGGQQWVV
ncbi:MAG: ribbon-helix-helix domain-containing protein [Gammaproteobacteria bacterium]|nr:ribbon-helix-helix domain-containing protein [Gammaproteobacteria bacterium]